MSCALPPYTRFFAAGLGTPYARRWVPAPQYRGSTFLLSAPESNFRPSFHVQIRPVGEGYFPVPVVQDWLNNPDTQNPPLVPGYDVPLDELSYLQSVDEVSELQGITRETASILKVRLKWSDGTTHIRSIDFDLGSGVDLITPPANWVKAELLIPVAGSELQLPPRVIDNPLGFASSIIARYDCLPNGIERMLNLTFTDTVYLDRDGPAGSVALIPRRRTTNRYEVTGTGEPLGETTAVWDRNPPGSPDVLGRIPIGSSFPVPAGNSFPQRGTTSQPRMAIPGGANAFIHQLATGVTAATVSLIQELTL
jgi:hypothetical protein